MASLSPQPSLQQPAPPKSPSLKNDGISTDKLHLPRVKVVQSIYDAALLRQHVVVSSPAATGKTSLLQLLHNKLEIEERNVTVLRINMNDKDTVDDLFVQLARKGIYNDLEKLKALEIQTWLLLDDAQNCYHPDFEPFWKFVVKALSTADVERNVFVVIAATYNLSTPTSPVSFDGLKRIRPDVTEKEARRLFQMHAEAWGLTDWVVFQETLIDISKLSSESPESFYHIGVVMAGVRMLDDQTKPEPWTEEFALAALRKGDFTIYLDRCFKLPHQLPVGYKERLVDVVTGGGQDVFLDDADALADFVKAGLLTSRGTFSTLAANWYYNRRCFPNRAAYAPRSLDELVIKATKLISARRLNNARVNGDDLPKEAAFQHLYNEAMSELLPLDNFIIPELNTLVRNPTNGPGVTGEVDFYVNGRLKWCIELLRNGKGIGEHTTRCDPNNGKYRHVDQLAHLVVDCRGPKVGGVLPHKFRCTLYFSEDFTTCECDMRLNPSIILELAD
jgi:hypothetical protein